MKNILFVQHAVAIIIMIVTIIVRIVCVFVADDYAFSSRVQHTIADG